MASPHEHLCEDLHTNEMPISYSLQADILPPSPLFWTNEFNSNERAHQSGHSESQPAPLSDPTSITFPLVVPTKRNASEEATHSIDEPYDGDVDDFCGSEDDGKWPSYADSPVSPAQSAGLKDFDEHTQVTSKPPGWFRIGGSNSKKRISRKATSSPESYVSEPGDGYIPTPDPKPYGGRAEMLKTLERRTKSAIREARRYRLAHRRGNIQTADEMRDWQVKRVERDLYRLLLDADRDRNPEEEICRVSVAREITREELDSSDSGWTSISIERDLMTFD